jgi:hypothetical protein
MVSSMVNPVKYLVRIQLICQYFPCFIAVDSGYIYGLTPVAAAVMAIPVSLQHSLCESENPRQVVVHQPKQPFRMPFNPMVEIAGILWFSSGIEKVRRLYSSGLRACWEFRYASREFELWRILGLWKEYWLIYHQKLGYEPINYHQRISFDGFVLKKLWFLKGKHVSISFYILYGYINCAVHLLKDLHYLSPYPIWSHRLCGPCAEGFMLSVQHIFLSTYKRHTIIMCEFRGPNPHSIPQSTLV